MKKKPPRLDPRPLRVKNHLGKGIVYPDGIPMKIHWEALTVGASVFVPAVNTDELKRQLRRIATLQGIKIKCVDRIESHKLGVRFWRMV